MAQTAYVGAKGKKVRSDCWMELRLRSKGGLDISLRSKVKSIYGKEIEKLCKKIIHFYGIQHAQLQIEDAGALPFVLAARLEAAIKLFKPKFDKEYLLPMEASSSYGTRRDRFRRSRLYLPGNQPKLFINAGIHQPDGIILDLEDSVPPSEKEATRYVVRNALRAVNFYGCERMVRINQLPGGLDDLDFIVPHNLHLVLIPKVEDAEQVCAIEARIQEIQKKCKTNNSIYLMPIIESALGIVNAYKIASSSPSVVALAIGLEDYTADIGTQRTNNGRESFYARSTVVNAARAAHIQPIDTVFSDVDDEESLRASVREAKSLGFDGKGCIHPRQIGPIHEEFAPSDSEIEKATKIVIAFETAQKQGLGVVSLGSKMIDPPVVKRAQRAVQLALQTNKLAKNWRKSLS